jgi:hypothetical protein
MRTLYILKTHGRASLSGEMVVISQGDDIVEKVPLPLLDQILRYMSKEVLHSNGTKAPRWAYLKLLARSFVRFVFDPSSDLMIPERR